MQRLLCTLVRKLEEGLVHAVVGKCEAQYLTGVGPILVGLPDIGVYLCLRVVLQATPSGAHCPLAIIAATKSSATKGLRGRGASSKDGQTLVTPQAELHRDGVAGLDRIDHRRILDRREKPLEGNRCRWQLPAPE